MKKLLNFFSVMMIAFLTLAGCGSSSADLNELVVYFVPSRNAEEIDKATEPLEGLLKEELAAQGFEFEDIKNTYLDKPLVSLESAISEITNSTDKIRGLVQNIDNQCEKINVSYINKIQSKINNF